MFIKLLVAKTFIAGGVGLIYLENVNWHFTTWRCGHIPVDWLWTSSSPCCNCRTPLGTCTPVTLQNIKIGISLDATMFLWSSSYEMLTVGITDCRVFTHSAGWVHELQYPFDCLYVCPTPCRVTAKDQSFNLRPYNWNNFIIFFKI